MRDFKHLGNKRSLSFRSFFSHKRKQSNVFKSLRETRPQKRRLAIILPILSVCLAAYPLFFLVTSPPWSFSTLFKHVPVSSPKSLPVIDASVQLKVAADLFSSVDFQGGSNLLKLVDGRTLKFTIDPSLQNKVQQLLVENEVPYAVFVAIEPKTGNILAMTGYSHADPQWSQDAYFRLYPMASLFKIITAAAALEQNKVGPHSEYRFTGYSYSENPKHWTVTSGSGGNALPLSLAMGKSINPVFGSIAADIVGRESIMSYAHRFGFNQTLFPGTPVLPSHAAAPLDEDSLKLMGAGLGREVKISPLHAAVIMAALANRGTMVSPILIKEVIGAENTRHVVEGPVVMRQLVKAETALKLEEMLLTTVTKGTSRRAFHDRQGRPKLGSVQIAAKTGSINGTDPVGYYTWFAAYAPVENPEIALVALIVNQDRWKIKASHLGEGALEQFFSTRGSDRHAMLAPK